MDILLNYFETGSGEPLILLHGNGENYTYFKHQIEYFADKYHIFALDTRGHGASPRGTAPFSIAQFAEDLYAFMETHAIPRANILGFSDGGNIALTFALKYPAKVKRLILNGANLFPGGVKQSIQIPIVIQYKVMSLFHSKSLKYKRKKELYGLMVHEPQINPQQLHSLSGRTLVIAGTNDMIKDKHTRLIYNSLPNAELVILNGDHFIASKKYTAFNKAVNSFLSFSAL